MKEILIKFQFDFGGRYPTSNIGDFLRNVGPGISHVGRLVEAASNDGDSFRNRGQVVRLANTASNVGDVLRNRGTDISQVRTRLASGVSNIATNVGGRVAGSLKGLIESKKKFVFRK